MKHIFALTGFGLVVACASAPPKVAEPVVAPKPVEAPAARAAEKELPPLPFLQSTKNLGEGKCRNDFDCYDSAGFPESGQRWECEKQRCKSEALPNQGSGSAAPGGNVERDKDEKSTSPRRPSRTAS